MRGERDGDREREYQKASYSFINVANVCHSKPQYKKKLACVETSEKTRQLCQRSQTRPTVK